jgi:integrase
MPMASVFRLADGRYRAVEQMDKEPLQAEGKTERLALDRLKEKIRNYDRMKPRPEMTVSAMLDAYIERCKSKGRAKSTIDDYTLHSQAWKARIGHKKIKDVTTQDVEDVLDATTGDKSPINRRALLRAAIRRIIIKRYPEFPNVAALAETVSYTPVGARPLMGSETEALISNEEDPRCLACWLLLLDTGLRPGEAYSLTWPEIIREEDGWWLKLDESKTDEGKKPIPLTESTVEALRKVAAHPTYIFPTTVRKKIKPYGETYWREKFGEAVIRAKIANEDRRVTPYSLRHTFASQMSRKVKDEVLRRLMRHKDIRTTKQYYLSDPDLPSLRAAKS